MSVWLGEKQMKDEKITEDTPFQYRKIKIVERDHKVELYYTGTPIIDNENGNRRSKTKRKRPNAPRAKKKARA